jgi:hypothetical protein
MTQSFFHTLRTLDSRHKLAGVLFLALAGLAPFPAFAQVTLGSVTNSVYTSFIPAQMFLSTVSFLLGVWYMIKGIQSLRSTGEGGQQPQPMLGSILKLGGAAGLISLPFVIDTVLRSLTGTGLGGDTIALQGDTTRRMNGPGLDEAVTRFVSDFFVPFIGDALPYFCYMAGAILMLRGMQRMVNEEKGPKAPAGFGTLTSFGVAAGLMSMGYFMKTLQGSIFGVTDLYANVTLCDNTSELTDRAQDVLWGVFQFLRIVGYIAVVRGLFQLKAYADGGQGSLLGASTFIISGAMLANVWYFIWVVQNTFVSDSSYFVFAEPRAGGGCT